MLIVSSIYPYEDPSIRGNDIYVYGIGFLKPFFSLDNENNLKAPQIISLSSKEKWLKKNLWKIRNN